MAKTVLKERLIVKAILATEARVHGHPLVTFVYVNTVDMGLHAYQVNRYSVSLMSCQSLRFV